MHVLGSLGEGGEPAGLSRNAAPTHSRRLSTEAEDALREHAALDRIEPRPTQILPASCPRARADRVGASYAFEMLRADVLAVGQRLVAAGRPVLSLDEIAEALGAIAIDSDEIDQLFAFLEARGVTVGDPTLGPASAALPKVLASARALRSELGRTPTVAQIAQHSGLDEAATRRALLFAQTLQHGR